MSQSRTPSGHPTGGQFVSTPHIEGGVSLGYDHLDLSTMYQEGLGRISENRKLEHVEAKAALAAFAEVVGGPDEDGSHSRAIHTLTRWMIDADARHNIVTGDAATTVLTVGEEGSADTEADMALRAEIERRHGPGRTRGRDVVSTASLALQNARNTDADGEELMAIADFHVERMMRHHRFDDNVTTSAIDDLVRDRTARGAA